MPLEITVGPPLLTSNQGLTILVTGLDGQILWPSDNGLYVRDTRVISAWQIYADGVEWTLLNSGQLTHFAARIVATNAKIATQDGDIEPRTVGLTIGRCLGRNAMHEDLDVTNYGRKPVAFNLELAIRSDFADIFEVKSGRIVRRGQITSSWSAEKSVLAIAYSNGDFLRRLTVTPKCETPRAYANGRISFSLQLKPGEHWHGCLDYTIEDGETEPVLPEACITEAQDSHIGRPLREWRRTVLKVETSNEEFYRLYRQAIDDMAALRLRVHREHELEFIPAAGVPWFVALFGRDSIIAALQSISVYPDFARGALDVLARHQATERDDYRDAEPGKIPHELRLGELAHFKMIPHTPYYGTADATPLYVVLLHAAWQCTGDNGLIDRHLEHAEKCLAWIDEYGDRDGDGFQEYQTRSPVGYENQSWKDAGDALLYADGTPVKGPKALVELQGYVYDAWTRMAQIYDAIGRGDRARELRKKAAHLYVRFNEAFWDEETGFYVHCLDGEKRQVSSIASNPGHCLWSGIIAPERARRVVDRLMAPDMWSGWGIRTLSSLHPAYNPLSYQNGSVWPHDNGIIAMGFKRYGFAAEAARIARAISEAGKYFMGHRLPELYAGLDRQQAEFPVQYLGANVPQAWAAGSVFTLLQALIGFQPDAPSGKLYLDPTLPDWMPDLTVRDLRVGDASVDLRFRREGSETVFEVLKGDKDSIERRRSVDADARLRPTV